MKVLKFLHNFLNSPLRNLERHRNGPVFLRTYPYFCNSSSAACPPCSDELNQRHKLTSTSPITYKDCTFNGTVLTIPQLESSDDTMTKGYYIVARETISTQSAFVFATLEDVNNSLYNVSYIVLIQIFRISQMKKSNRYVCR